MPEVTPGAVLTTDATVVCVPRYALAARHISTVSRRAVDRRYDYTPHPGAQQYDHLVPIELGGANAVTNLWPQPAAEAKIKDRLENRLHRDVCAGRTSLHAAQTCIRTDWAACWNQTTPNSAAPSFARRARQRTEIRSKPRTMREGFIWEASSRERRRS
jgi:hypothetical protein